MRKIRQSLVQGRHRGVAGATVLRSRNLRRRYELKPAEFGIILGHPYSGLVVTRGANESDTFLRYNKR
jgi:hypothetical protein